MHINPDVFHAVRRRQHLGPNHATQGLVPWKRAAVVDMFRIDRQDDAVLVQRHARIQERALVPMRARLHVLDARLDPFHSAPARLARSQRTHRHVRIAGDLDPKASSNVIALHVNLVDAHAQRRRQKLRRKRRKRIVAVILDIAGTRVPVRQDHVALERRTRKAMEVQSPDVHDVRRLLQRFLHVAVFEHPVPIPVRPHRRMQQALVFQRIFCSNHGRQRFVIHFD